GAEVITLPEIFTPPIVFRAEVHGAVLPPDTAAVALLRRVARRHGGGIGGLMLIAEGADACNRYHLVEPAGTPELNAKHPPTMWENAFYGPGSDDGVARTGSGRVGMAVCWELIRNQTARRMLDRVDLVMTGTHWWTVPANWGPVGRVFATVAGRNQRLSESAP